MCDIWKGNAHLRQLSEEDVSGLLLALRRLGTKEVVMSGGEALLHPLFFRFCSLLKQTGVRISLLTTGLGLRRHADALLASVDSIIVSLDGDRDLHDRIRNVKGAFDKLAEGVQYIKSVRPSFPISTRTVIHKLNYEGWIPLIDAARKIGADQMSFLPADVSSEAFNREIRWTEDRQSEIKLDRDDLSRLEMVIDAITKNYGEDLGGGFIAESAEKLVKIHTYYAALNGMGEFPFKKCNAPWVSTVINPDGSVQPCFFHPAIGNIHDAELPEILNGEKGMMFRRQLDMDTNPVCKKCVCYLNLRPGSMV
jgi:MoaA/NifB/PqqE/SkfB family radical SAM enzyme